MNDEALRRQKISSASTFFIVAIMPILMTSIVILIEAGIVFGFLKGGQNDPRWLQCFFPLLILGIVIFQSSKMKEIVIVGDQLEVSNFKKSISIPLRSVQSISYKPFLRGLTVIQLESASQFGSNIWFIPRFKFSDLLSFGFKSSAVAELENHVEKVKRL